jgi:hypothetical protein
MIQRTLLILLIFLSSCNCKKKDKVSGEIINDIEIDKLFEAPNGRCYNLPKKFCVYNDSAFNEIFKLKNATDCDAIVLPSIDFSKFSLLVYWREDNGNVTYEKNISIDSTNKTVTYTIQINDHCACPDKCMRNGYNMVLTKKISEDYTVNYQ